MGERSFSRIRTDGIRHRARRTEGRNRLTSRSFDHSKSDEWKDFSRSKANGERKGVHSFLHYATPHAMRASPQDAVSGDRETSL